MSLTIKILNGIFKNVRKIKLSRQKKHKSAGYWRRKTRWLQPGLGIKRWLVLMIIATVLIGLGFAYLLLDIYQANPSSRIAGFLSMSALAPWLRIIVLAGGGMLLLVVSMLNLNRSILKPFIKPGKEVIEVVARHRRLGRGPKIVAIGGGTGLSTLLRGLKEYSANVTAIVTVADDGGSSGRLRRSLGLPPPGDIRACLAALSDDEDLLTQLFKYRFREGGELDGHSFGNLFIAALAGVTGSFDQGVREAGRVLAIRGEVIPSTLKDLVLQAHKSQGFGNAEIRVNGESLISEFPGKIKRVGILPDDPLAYPPAIHAILNADLIVIGPGSLYTSILPNLLVPDIRQSIEVSRAFRVLVCNVANQPGETNGFTCEEHWDAIKSHVGNKIVDLFLINESQHISAGDEIDWVSVQDCDKIEIPVHRADLVNEDYPHHHDPFKLAEELIEQFQERTGPLEYLAGDEAIN